VLRASDGLPAIAEYLSFQVISAYRQSASQFPPAVGGVDYRSRPYALPPPELPYYSEPRRQSHGYGLQTQQSDQIVYQLQPQATVLGPPNSATTGDRYAWKIAGFSQCSQTCGGGQLFCNLLTTLVIHSVIIYTLYDSLKCRHNSTKHKNTEKKSRSESLNYQVTTGSSGEL